MNIRTTLLLLLLIGSVQAQDRVEYDTEFKFEDGVYLSFQDFKNNNSIPITHLVSNLDIRNPDYLGLVLNTDSLTYFDNLYEERKRSILNIWGYAKAGKIYIGYNTAEGSVTWDNRGWFQILSLGAYSYFTAVITVSRFTPPTSGTLMQSRDAILDDGSMYSNQVNYYDETIPIQLLLDFANGNLMRLATGDLNSVPPKLMTNLISSDSDLLSNYNALTKREQKQSGMFYIRQFNQKNPINFPE
jgi:hypothetical protein